MLCLLIDTFLSSSPFKPGLKLSLICFVSVGGGGGGVKKPLHLPQFLQVKLKPLRHGNLSLLPTSKMSHQKSLKFFTLNKKRNCQFIFYSLSLTEAHCPSWGCVLASNIDQDIPETQGWSSCFWHPHPLTEYFLLPGGSDHNEFWQQTDRQTAH